MEPMHGRQIIENAHEGIWAVDEKAVITFVNPRMAGMLGYGVEEMVGRPISTFMDEHGRRIMQTHLERRRSGMEERYDFEFVRKDGARVYARQNTSPRSKIIKLIPICYKHARWDQQ